MSVINKLKEAAEKALKSSKKNLEGKSSKAPNSDKHWEDGDLDSIEEALKQGISWGTEKSKTGWTNPDTGDYFSPEHYKKGLEYDKKALARVRKEKILRKLMPPEQISKKMSKSKRKRDEIDDWIED